MNRHRCAENCDWRNVGAILNPNPMKCCEKIGHPFNERDRAATLRFDYPERPPFPAVTPTRQRPAFFVANMRPRFPIKSARFCNASVRVCDDPRSATSECGEPKNALGCRCFERLARKAAQFSESLQIVCAAAREKTELHRPQLAAMPILPRP